MDYLAEQNEKRAKKVRMLKTRKYGKQSLYFENQPDVDNDVVNLNVR